MNLKAYIFTVNRNRGAWLDDQELKDVIQDTEITLSQKNYYTDQLIRLTILSAYRSAVNRKARAQQLSQELAHTQVLIDNSDEIEIEQSRAARIECLKVSKIQKKIVRLLVSGADYSEVRKKLRLTSQQLRDHVKSIKKNNSQKVSG
jgi:Zn-finger nucleic acid-binding protein